MSLDGASTDELHQLYREGVLSAGGFARFFKEGQVADRLVPVDPTLTAVNHISLATGYPAEKTGIVGNSFHVAGAPFLDKVAGFAAPIETETLWEAVRRQGKRAGVMTWPGADAEGPRRRADWGMVYINNPDRRPDLVTVEADSWKPAEETARDRGIESYSPVRGLKIEVGEGAPGSQTFELLAVDHSDDGKTGYDRLVVLAPGKVGGSPPLLLAQGRWANLPCEISSPEGGSEGMKLRTAICPVKLLNLDPGLASTRIYFSGVYSLQAYPSEFASDLAGERIFWPGPPDNRRLSESLADHSGIDLDTWLEQSERFARFFGDSLIVAAQRTDWDLLMGYMPAIDEAGHQLLLTDPRQPGFSPERRIAFEAARRRVWQAVDRELARLLKTLDLRTTVVAVVSDHGMAPVHSVLDVNVLLRDEGLLASDAKGKIVEQGTSVYGVASGAGFHVYLAPGAEALLPRLRALFSGWLVNGERPVERVFTREDAAEVHLDNPNSGDLILFLREGYVSGNGMREGKVASPPVTLGVHGYLNTHPDMHGIYLALGAGIGRRKAGTMQSTEVAGLVATWLGIEKPRPSPEPE